MKQSTNIGKRLRLLRRFHSQKTFAKILDIPLRTYQDFESGKRIPNAKTLLKIADRCDTTLDWILTEDLNEEKNIVLEGARTSIYLVEIIENLIHSQDKGKLLSPEDLKRLSDIFVHQKKFLNFLKAWLDKTTDEGEGIGDTGKISSRIALYSILSRVEDLFNRGETEKVNLVSELLDVFKMEGAPWPFRNLKRLYRNSENGSKRRKKWSLMIFF